MLTNAGFPWNHIHIHLKLCLSEGYRFVNHCDASCKGSGKHTEYLKQKMQVLEATLKPEVQLLKRAVGECRNIFPVWALGAYRTKVLLKSS